MADDLIEDIRKVLLKRKRSDLAKLLRYSTSEIQQSSTYGSRLFSLISTLQICSPFEEYEQLKNLCDGDEETIIRTALEVIPPQDYGPEIAHIEFLLNIEIEPNDRTVLCEGLKQIGFEYIPQQMTKCEDKIRSCDYDGAITNARTLVENVCLYVLEESDINYKPDGDLPKLFKAVYNVLQMDPALYQQLSVKQILSGLISIINGLSNLRNEMSDAHGKAESKYYRPTDRHALLAVNAAKTVSEFIYTSWKSKLTQK